MTEKLAHPARLRAHDLSAIAASALIVVLLALFQNLAAPATHTYQTFRALKWQKLQGCAPEVNPPALRMPTKGISLLGTNEARCRSESFIPPAPIFEIEYAAHYISHALIILRLFGPDGKEIYRRPLPSNNNPGLPAWHILRIKDAKLSGNTPITFELQGALHEDGEYFSLRDRTAWFTKTRPPLLHGGNSRFIFCLLLAAALIWFSITVLLAPCSNATLFVLCFLLSAGLHFRSSLFFFWDEWHVLQRFQELGAGGAIYTHNEHFLPLYFGFYYLEAGLFGDKYWCIQLVSLALHALNAVLLNQLLLRLVPGEAAAQKACRILTIFFLVSALHIETLQWNFEQCVILVQLVSTAAVLHFEKFMAQNLRRHLLFAAILIGTAPLIFGNGFTAIFQIAAITLTIAALRRPESMRRTAIGLAAAGTALVLPAFLYIMFRQSGAGHGVAQANLFGNLRAVGEYLLIGTQLGTVLRSLSLFPSLELGAAPVAVSLLQHVTGLKFLASRDPGVFCAAFGLAVSAVLLAFYRLSANRKQFVLLWACGQVYLLLSFALPALGRWHFGSQQSLALRYQYNALIGFCIAALPVVLAFVQAPENSALARWRRPAQLFVLIQTGVQLWLILSFSYFVESGTKHLEYFAALQDWRTQLQEFKTTSYEGVQTPLEGLQPAYPQTITPGRHPNQLYDVLLWLRPQRNNAGK